MEEKVAKNRFQETLNLPKTDFPLRAHAQHKEQELLHRWEKDNLNQHVTNKNNGKKKFILHFGPPYANGHLHIGHTLTETLKDILCKSKRMAGFYTPLVPGWDCHGLPIEFKVMAQYVNDQDKLSANRVIFKKYCREYAQHWVDVQMQELKEHAIFADYAHAYNTMDPAYEALTLQAFACFVEYGYIERKLKTVPWCGSCKTVLAAAEIEYKDRKDPSIYALFPLPTATAQKLFSALYIMNPHLRIYFALWTTMPWSIPLNRGVGLNPNATYVVLRGKRENQGIIVAKDRADAVCTMLGIEVDILAECDAVLFQGSYAEHPLIANLQVPVFLDQAVLTNEGTACFSCAPGCGPEDYALAIKHNLEIYSPLSTDGTYSKGILPTELEGMSVTDGQKWVTQKLSETGHLVHHAMITHSYPHCWRCHGPLMFRATNQWFCNLTKNNLIERTLAEIEQTNFIPERGKTRLASFISNRTEWCISRQRQWGNPITAILCTACDWTFLQADFIRTVAQRVAQEGIEFWDRMTMQTLINEKLLPLDFMCATCGNTDLTRFDLERDILDVWFDSGVSNYAVLAQEPEKLGFPADVYFEGSDQHRGWFQSSLLCGMVMFDHAPMKTIITHGFVNDENKHKMSKSANNGIAPEDVMAKFSRDILRLWVANSDYENDVTISDMLLTNIAEMYRKIRNTCRFLIANLYDFNATDAVALEQMHPLDQYALAQLYELNGKVRHAYDQYQFALAIQMINTYCTNTLSATYLDILKDRLYAEKANSNARRSAQTAVYAILDALSHLLAPILSFLAEELSDAYQRDKSVSIHLQEFPMVCDVWSHLAPLHMQDMQLNSTGSMTTYQERMHATWNMLESLRSAVFKIIEEKRAASIIKHSYEAEVHIFIDPTSKEYELLAHFTKELERYEKVTNVPFNNNQFLATWFIVSQVTIEHKPDGMIQSTIPWGYIDVRKASGDKCPRCWQWSETKHSEGLCGRCVAVLGDV